jgi:hypothetical protein
VTEAAIGFAYFYDSGIVLFISGKRGSYMKLLQLTLIVTFFTLLGSSCAAQRDVNTASARAAYSVPTSSGYHGNKARKKKKAKARNTKKSGKRNTDSILRKRPFGL